MFDKLMNEARKSPLDLVAQFGRVRLYRDRIELLPSNRPDDRTLPAQTKSLTGVRARVSACTAYLTVTGPGFEWEIRTDAGWSSWSIREFVALIDSAARSADEAFALRCGVLSTVDLAGQVAQLAELHRCGALTDAEFTAAKARLLS